VVGLLALGSHGESPKSERAAPAAARPADAKAVPADLDALNGAARQMYADARARELAAIPVAIVVSGDDLVLRRNGKRTAAAVIPAEYHALKCVAHSTLALFAHLASEPGQPLGADRVKTLKEYQTLLTAAGPAVEKFGFDPDTLACLQRVLARALDFTAAVLRDGKVSADELAKFCRASRPDVMAVAAAAARLQVRAMHKQVMAWKADMTADEWAGLAVVVCGTQTPRADNLAVQYFSRLLGEPRGEGRRVVYAESLWDEEKAVNLLGTLRLDGKLAVAVFADPARMYRDLLADGARAAIDDLLAAP
jgi:hypothetical protein